MSYNVLLSETNSGLPVVEGGPSYGADYSTPRHEPIATTTFKRKRGRFPGSRNKTRYLSSGLGAVPSLDSYIAQDLPFFEEPAPEVGRYGAPWWASIVGQGIATTPAIIAASKKSPVPGYPGSSPTPVYQQYPTSGSYAPGGGSGINLSGGISTNTLMMIGLGVALFMVGTSRGRR